MVDQFELERFEWQAPDRLEIAGKFHGLQAPPAGDPVLVVSGGGAAHRLEAVPEIVDGPPEDGKAWRAQFIWDEAPVGVDSAVLEVGPDIVVDLPPPGTERAVLRPRSLESREETAHVRTAASSDVALQADLVAAEQHAQELRAALERAGAEIARARADLEANARDAPRTPSDSGTAWRASARRPSRRWPTLSGGRSRPRPRTRI